MSQYSHRAYLSGVFIGTRSYNAVRPEYIPRDGFGFAKTAPSPKRARSFFRHAKWLFVYGVANDSKLGGRFGGIEASQVEF